MKLKIDVDIGTLSVQEFFTLYCINYSLDQVFINNEYLKSLIRDKYILYIQSQNKYILTAKAKKFFNTSVNINIDQLAMQYRELFPNIKVSGYPARSNLKEIQAKFERFFKKYKYNPEIILESTKIYIDEKRKINWSYLTTAKHFIIKKKPQLEEEVSELATYCDHYLEKGTEYVEQNNMI
jgi:hypothetical protein